MAEVALSGVTKSWGATPAVDRISFSAPPGRLVALLGPSGCGKSTTLRLIAGLETASAGTIAIGGPRRHRRCRRPSAASRWCSRATRCFRTSRSPRTSCSGCKVRDVPRPSATRASQRAAGILGLDELLERKPSQLSGGQQQRVALGRAIVAETPVCLMDEPLSNLDAQLRVEMRREIRALQRRLGMTMVYVTHDQVEAMTMADQVVLMRNGRIEQDAPPAELYERPATIFAARFIGTPPMNVLPAALVTAARWMPHAARRRARRRPRRDACGRRPAGGRASRARRRARDRRGGRISRRRHADRDPGRGASPSSVRVAGRAAAQRRRDGRISPGTPPPRTGSICRRNVASTRCKNAQTTREEHHGPQTVSRRHRGARRPARSPSRRSRKATTEVSFFYPVAVGGPITKIIDGYRGRLREGEPGDQGEADLFRHLPGDASSRRSPRTRAARRR